MRAWLPLVLSVILCSAAVKPDTVRLVKMFEPFRRFKTYEMLRREYGIVQREYEQWIVARLQTNVTFVDSIEIPSGN